MEIKCEFKLSDYNVQGKYENIYTCVITEANITKKRQDIKAFIGIHAAGKINNDVKGIRFQNTKVDYFPRSVIKHFPNLICLDIGNCGTKEISRNDLRGFGGLVRLGISNCPLSSLADDLFSAMPNLLHVSFLQNQIKFASSQLLKPLLGRQNVYVDLENNKNINAWLWPGDTRSLNSLDHLMEMIDEKCIKPALLANGQYVEHEPIDLHPKIKELWTSGNFSDLTITAGDKKFKVHKNILGMQSEVFAEIFRDQIEATEIKIPEFSSKSVEALLKFMYTNEETDEENAKENFEIAEKFKIADMKSIYEQIICDQIDDSNALEMFMLAHRFNSQLIKENAFDVICINCPDKIPDTSMEDPKKLKKILDARRELDNLLKDDN